MSTFPIREDEYSVEEISYEDMVTLLSEQEKHHVESMLILEQPDTTQEPLFRTENSPESIQNPAPQLSQDELSSRLSENANQSLPAWLLNH